MSDVSGGKFLMKTYGSNVSQLSFKLPPVVVPAPAENKTKMISIYIYYIPGVARLFCSRANFQKKNSSVGRNKKHLAVFPHF